KASDIHIEPTRENLRVRFRLDGVLYPSLVLPLKIHPAVVARIKILGGLKIDETRLPQDGRFSTVIGDRRIDFRVSSFPTELGEKVAIRILDPEKGIKSLDELGLQDRDFKIVEETIKSLYGIILVTGPTGCGKITATILIIGASSTNLSNSFFSTSFLFASPFISSSNLSKALSTSLSGT
ncbi:unnamed protein product, partial [marine sediment metagenome]